MMERLYVKGLVSVIIPTYGRIHYLKETIESVLSQSYKYIEIIVVDDNGIGTENQLRVNNLMDTFTIANGKVSYFALDVNRGGSYARNFGARHAVGEFLAFLDDDDLFEPDKIKEQIELLNENSSLVACICSHKRFFMERDVYIDYIMPYTSGDLRLPILSYKIDACSGSSILLRHLIFKKINGFSTSLKRFQDYEFLARLSFVGYIGIINKPLLIVRVHSGSNSLKSIQDIVTARVEYLRIISDCVKTLEPSVQTKVYDINYYFLFKAAIKHRSYSIAKKYFYKISNKSLAIVNLVSDSLKYLSK